MDDIKIRKINKKKLLEILLSQAKRIEELEQQLESTQKKLDSKKITIENSGSLAEASLKLNGIFEMAQATAEQYLLNIKDKCKKIENDTKKECQIEIEKMIKETKMKCQQKEALVDEKLKKIELKNGKEKNANKKIVDTERENNNKVLVEKSKRVIKGRPIKTIKKEY